MFYRICFIVRICVPMYSKKPIRILLFLYTDVLNYGFRIKYLRYYTSIGHLSMDYKFKICSYLLTERFLGFKKCKIVA